MEVQCAHFGGVERTSAAAAEDGQLIAGFIDGAIAIYAFRNSESGPTCARGGDQFRNWARRETGEVSGVVPRRNNLQDTKTIVAIGDEREGAAGDHSDFDVVHFMHGVVRVEDLVEPRGFGIFDVENSEA